MNVLNFINDIKRKPLITIAIFIWILIGVSTLARELMVFSTIADIGKNFVLVNNFFDTAASRMNAGWEHFDEEMKAFQQRFDQQSDDFHRWHHDAFQKSFESLGYEISEDGSLKEREKPKVASAKPSEIQKAWEKDILSCNDKFNGNGDAYIKCLQARAKFSKEQNVSNK